MTRYYTFQYSLTWARILQWRHMSGVMTFHIIGNSIICCLWTPCRILLIQRSLNILMIQTWGYLEHIFRKPWDKRKLDNQESPSNKPAGHILCQTGDISSHYAIKEVFPDSKVHGTNMGLTWVLSAPDGPHVGPMNLAIRVTSNSSVWISILLKTAVHRNMYPLCINTITPLCVGPGSIRTNKVIIWWLLMLLPPPGTK